MYNCIVRSGKRKWLRLGNVDAAILSLLLLKPPGWLTKVGRGANLAPSMFQYLTAELLEGQNLRLQRWGSFLLTFWSLRVEGELKNNGLEVDGAIKLELWLLENSICFIWRVVWTIVRFRCWKCPSDCSTFPLGSAQTLLLYTDLRTHWVRMWGPSQESHCLGKNPIVVLFGFFFVCFVLFLLPSPCPLPALFVNQQLCT